MDAPNSRSISESGGGDFDGWRPHRPAAYAPKLFGLTALPIPDKHNTLRASGAGLALFGIFDPVPGRGGPDWISIAEHDPSPQQWSAPVHGDPPMTKRRPDNEVRS
jgi:hypothetical protein